MRCVCMWRGILMPSRTLKDSINQSCSYSYVSDREDSHQISSPWTCQSNKKVTFQEMHALWMEKLENYFVFRTQRKDKIQMVVKEKRCKDQLQKFDVWLSNFEIFFLWLAILENKYAKTEWICLKPKLRWGVEIKQIQTLTTRMIQSPKHHWAIAILIQ